MLDIVQHPNGGKKFISKLGLPETGLRFKNDHQNAGLICKYRVILRILHLHKPLPFPHNYSNSAYNLDSFTQQIEQ